MVKILWLTIKIQIQNNVAVELYKKCLTVPWQGRTPSCHPLRVWPRPASWREPVGRAGGQCCSCKEPCHTELRTGSNASPPLWAVWSWIKNKTNSMYDLVTFTRRQIVQIPAELALANTWSFTEMKCSYSGREPHQSLALVVHEHLRLGSDELIKQVEEEVPLVDVHHLSLIHKLHLGRRACLNDPQNTNPISSDDKYPSMTYNSWYVKTLQIDTFKFMRINSSTSPSNNPLVITPNSKTFVSPTGLRTRGYIKMVDATLPPTIQKWKQNIPA